MLNGVRYHLNSEGKLYRWDAATLTFSRVLTIGFIDSLTLGIQPNGPSENPPGTFRNLES